MVKNRLERQTLMYHHQYNAKCKEVVGLSDIVKLNWRQAFKEEDLIQLNCHFVPDAFFYVKPTFFSLASIDLSSAWSSKLQVVLRTSLVPDMRKLKKPF